MGGIPKPIIPWKGNKQPFREKGNPTTANGVLGILLFKCCICIGCFVMMNGAEVKQPS
jgi:hypothetical protein